MTNLKRRRWRDWHEPSLGLWHWRDQGGSEVDLLLERDRKITAVGCKIREQPQRKDLQGIERLRKFYGKDEVPKAHVACPTGGPFDLQRGITAVSG